MKTKIAILAGLMLLVAIPIGTTAQPQAPCPVASASQLKEWIVQLGDDDYGNRKAAFQALADHADAALPLLQEELKKRGEDSNIGWWLKATIQECEASRLNPGDIAATPDHFAGLTVCDACTGDGPFTVVERDGTRCWEVSHKGNYLYFIVGNDFRQYSGPVEIELDVLDTKFGDVLLEYDSKNPRAAVDGAYETHPVVVRRKNSGQWQRIHFRITDARFNGAQNGGSDFRFNNDGDDLVVRAVRVRRVTD